MLRAFACLSSNNAGHFPLDCASSNHFILLRPFPCSRNFFLIQQLKNPHSFQLKHSKQFEQQLKHSNLEKNYDLPNFRSDKSYFVVRSAKPLILDYLAEIIPPVDNGSVCESKGWGDVVAWLSRWAGRDQYVICDLAMDLPCIKTSCSWIQIDFNVVSLNCSVRVYGHVALVFELSGQSFSSVKINYKLMSRGETRVRCKGR